MGEQLYVDDIGPQHMGMQLDDLAQAIKRPDDERSYDELTYEVQCQLALVARHLMHCGNAVVRVYDPQYVNIRMKDAPLGWHTSYIVYACKKHPIYGIRFLGFEQIEFIVFSGAPPVRIIVPGSKYVADVSTLPSPLTRLVNHLNNIRMPDNVWRSMEEL